MILNGKEFEGVCAHNSSKSGYESDSYEDRLFVADCAIALMEVVPQSASREEFISGMVERGWSVQWEDKRKHIVFQNENGDKVRDSNIEKTFTGMEVNKEVLTNEFTGQNELRLAKHRADRAREAARERESAEYTRYYAEVESAITGIDNAKAVRDNTSAEKDDRRFTVSDGSYISGMETLEETGQTRGHRDDTEALLRDIRADISDSRSQSRAVIRTENQSVAYNEQSVSRETERRLEEQRRAIEQERAREAYRRSHQHKGPSL
ncbi:MAG: hypothetical protein K6G27_13270 [Lachnospiraceae bacterium]|nr:hypothetical protein [Lachnospiraceae bacterium]